MYVSICFEFDKVVFFEFDKFCLCKEEKKEKSFAYVKKKKRGKKEVMTSTSNVYMNWLKLNMKI